MGFPRLPVLKVILGAFTLPWQHRADLMGPAALPLMAVFASLFAWRRYDFENLDLWFAVVFLASCLAMSSLAVTVHRLVLLTGDEARSAFDSQTLRRVGSYTASVIGLWMVIIVVALAVTAVAFAILGGKPIFSGTELLRTAWTQAPIGSGWVLYPAIVIGLWAAARMCLVLPAIAVKHKADFGGAWRESKGNGWRLAVVFGVLPLCLDQVPMLFVRGGASMLESGVLAALASLLVVVEVVALSLSYRELTSPAPPPTHPLS